MTLRTNLAETRRTVIDLIRQPTFHEGALECAPVAVGIGSWGLVAGVAMSNSGMDVSMTILMSVLVSAGTSQVAALPLIAADAPLWVILLTVMCVNLRFVVYSYQCRPYFAHLSRTRRLVYSYFMGDTTFGGFVRRFPDPKPSPGQESYFLGTACVTYAVWQLAVLAGILAGTAIPPQWGLGFAGTMALMALMCGQLNSASTCVAALLAGCAAVAAYGLPLRMNILVAVSVAVAVGVLARHARRASD